MKNQESQEARERAAYLLTKPHVQVIQLPAIPEGASLLELVFTPAWARMDRSGVVSTQDFAVMRDQEASVLRLEVTPGARPSELRIPVIGEPLDLVKFLFFDRFRAPTLALVRPNGVCASDPDVFHEVPTRSPLAQSFDLWGHIAAVDAELDSVPGLPVTSYRRFFAEMNKETHPDFLNLRAANGVITPAAANKVNTNVGWLMTELGDRLFQRAYHFAQGNACPDPYDYKLDLGVHKNKIQSLSDILLGLARAHLGKDGEVDPAKFAEAFECFANGQLRFQVPSGLWTTQPSSGYYFFFAEFAMLAIYADVEAETWCQLAGVLIRTQEVFARVYPPQDAQPVYNSYRSCDYDPLQIWVPSELQALAAANPLNDAVSRCQKASQNALDYLPGLFP